MAKFQVPISKAAASLEVDTDALDEEDFKYVIAEGLKAIMNARMSKVPPAKGKEGKELDDLRASAMLKAEENKTLLFSGKLRAKAGAKKAKSASTLTREEQTEARRLARERVKDLIRDSGRKPSHFKISEITAAADVMIAENPEILAQARENLARRASIAAPSADLLATLKVDPELVAKDEAKKAKDKEARKGDGTLSAKQAGIPKPHIPVRQRPGTEAPAIH